MLPEGWRKKSFGDVVYIANGLVDPREASFKNTKHIGPENVISDTGRIVNERTCGDLKLISGKYEFDKHSIVYSKIRPNLNKVCTPSYSGVCSADMYVLHPRKGIDKNFLFFSILGDTFKNRAISMSMRTGMPKINREDLSSIPILLPPLPEQKKIAAILSTWDRAIEGTEKLLANSQQQKKALMQQLLTGKKRLPGFTGEWKNYTLENILNVRKEKSLPSNKIPLFSLTIDGGITSKTDRYNREFLVKNKNEKKYKVVYPRDLVYNPANLRWGAINYSRIPHKVVVSPIYEVLYVNNIERFFPDLIYQYLMSPFQIEKFSSMIEGTLMERKAVKISPFLATKIRIPCDFSEQQAIAAVLNTADEEITALEYDLSRLRQEKKALMQQLLTGKRRVKVD
ncbi:restriction endonuclease subunit S [Acetobacter pasteurianus NBRC 3299]|nr:restriction endonuclease subunit S [Acetobacter pasteurianus]GCD75130.1 restriction endonuclease subunit S [Acetobacter pasteurianus NBRC 3299]